MKLEEADYKRCQGNGDRHLNRESAVRRSVGSRSIEPRRFFRIVPCIARVKISRRPLGRGALGRIVYPLSGGG